MKLPLIAACFIAGSTWSFAFADATSATNQKTAPRPYSASQTGSSLGTQSTPVKQTPAALRQSGIQQKKADVQRSLQNPADQAQSDKIRAAIEKAREQEAAAEALHTAGQPQRPALQTTQQRKRALGIQPVTPAPHSMLVAAPVNDDCSAAIVISGAGPFATDTTTATTGSQMPSCTGFMSLDIWYEWTAGSTGNATMEMCGGPSYDSVIAAYAGAGCPLGSSIGCNDDGCAPLSTMTFPVTAGSTYMLQVGGWNGNSGAGSFTINVLGAIPVDDCSLPQVISGLGSFAFDTTTMTTGGQQPQCTGLMTNDMWFQWVAPSSGNCFMDTCGSVFDTVIAAYDGAGCPINPSIACNDQGICGGVGTIQSATVFPVTGGNTYTIQVGGWNGASGTGTLNLNVLLPQPFDDCSGPQVISGLGSFPFDNTLMTTGGQQPSCTGLMSSDMWFQWVAPSSGNCFMDTCGSSFDTVIAAYDGAGCPINPSIACNDQGLCGGVTTNQSATVFAVTSGNTYTIQVGGWNGASGTGTLNLNVLVPQPLDDCALPQVISGNGSFPFDNTLMTTGPQQSFCGGGAQNDLWFQWTPTVTGVASMDTCGSAFDTVIAAWDGAGCPVNPALACNDDGSCPLQSSLTFPATAGNTYMLQVGGFFGATGTGNLNLTVLIPPANDDCATPAPIAGLGVFPYDNTACSTGADGQSEALCMAFGNPAIQNDLWFSWVSPMTGPVSADTCGLTGLITKIAVYSGTGCPVAGTALACGELNCGNQSRALFNATAGTTYTIQLGTWVFGTGGGAGSFELIDATPPANDDCSTPTAISGTGSFPYDITFATTGVDGQSESLCNFFSTTAITTDAWFTWTSTGTGCTVIDVCGSGLDGKMSVYAGSGCPTPGTSIACNDDAGGTCGLAPQVRFIATAGSTYTIQLGTWPFGAAGNSGFLNVVQTPAGIGNDECSAPTTLVGTGLFPYDNTAGTTGCEGQDVQNCGGTIFNDVWFQWTAPTTGYAVYSTCPPGVSAEDTILAAYPGPGCPAPGSSLACSDDACGVAGPSTAIWAVTAGTNYTLQLGDFGATPGGAGFISLEVILPPGACDTLDDGTVENLWSTGVAAGTTNDNVWLVRFGELATSTTIDSIDIMYGALAFPGNAPPNGTPTDIMLYADGPSQDGDPTDATLLATIPSTAQLVDTDTYVNIPLPTPITVSGYFFAGGHESAGLGIWVAPNDTGSFWSGRSFIFGNNSSGLADLTTPSNNLQPPVGLEAFGGAGNFCVRVHCSFGPATYTCTPGDPGINLCPCSNPPTGSNRGCDNQQATGGASITGSGTASVSSSSLVFTTAGENASVGSVLIQGTAFNAGISFGHGVRCAAGAVKRLYIKIASGGSITAPGGLDPSIPVRSAALAAPILPGDTRYYQVYYRDTTVSLPGCPVLANRFNVSNAAVVVWQP